MHSVFYCGILFLFCCSCLKSILFSIVAFYFYFTAVACNTFHFLLWHSVLLQSLEKHSIFCCSILFLFCCSHLKCIAFSIVAFCFYFAALVSNAFHFLLWHSIFLILLQSLEMHPIFYCGILFLFCCSHLKCIPFCDL